MKRIGKEEYKLPASEHYYDYYQAVCVSTVCVSAEPIFVRKAGSPWKPGLDPSEDRLSK